MFVFLLPSQECDLVPLLVLFLVLLLNGNGGRFYRTTTTTQSKMSQNIISGAINGHCW